MARNSHAAGYVAILLLLCTSAHAQDGLQGGTGVSNAPAPVGSATGDLQVWNAQQSGVWGICTPDGDFEVTPGGSCALGLHGAICHNGPTTGDVATEFDPFTTFGSNNVNMGNVPSFLFPDVAQQACDDDTDCPGNAGDYTCEGGTCEGDDDANYDGRLCGEDTDCVDTDGTPNCLNAICTPNRDTGSDGGSATRLNTTTERIDVGVAAGKMDSVALGAPIRKVGGKERTNNFLYHAETGSCSGDVCRSGTCSAGPLCTLTANSDLTRSIAYPGVGQTNAQGADTALTSVVLQVYDFNHTGGTVTTAPTLGALGSVLWIRAAHDIIINNEDGTAIIDMMGKGGRGTENNSAATAPSAGRIGGHTTFAAGGGGGPSGANAGSAGGNVLLSGQDCDASWVTPPIPGHWLPLGSGGGSATESTPVYTVNPFLPWEPRLLAGGAGGGGPGCNSSVTGTPGNGGRSGGGVILEAGRRIELRNVTIDVRGAAGGTGASGGGGGDIWMYAAEIIEENVTYLVDGGAAGSTLTNCGAGTDGGDGCVGKWVVPY